MIKFKYPYYSDKKKIIFLMNATSLRFGLINFKKSSLLEIFWISAGRKKDSSDMFLFENTQAIMLKH